MSPAEARPAGVNRPELLPKRFTPVIDVAGFLSEGQVSRFLAQGLSVSRMSAVLVEGVGHARTV
jgi:hypothetical protein